jgi:hypothetical protein
MTRNHLSFITAAGLVAVVFSSVWQFASSAAIAEGTTTILRVEEDWELVIGTPNPNSVSPQITCVFAPTGNFNSLSGVFELNHQSQPKFAVGGLHIHVWKGEFPLTIKSSHGLNVMSHGNETVRWTQAMTLVNGHLVVEVSDGTSTTWGAFGNDGNLKTTAPTTLVNLNTYNPQFSVDNSGVGYAAHRVKSLVLKRIRLIAADGNVSEDSNARTVFPQN